MSTQGRSKAASLAILLLCEVGAMTVWFSSASVVATLEHVQAVTAQSAALMTSSLQAGFVLGTILSAVLSLADRFDPRRLFMASALIAAACTACLAFLPPTGLQVYALRFVTGMWQVCTPWACAWPPLGRVVIWDC